MSTIEYPNLCMIDVFMMDGLDHTAMCTLKNKPNLLACKQPGETVCVSGIK